MITLNVNGFSTKKRREKYFCWFRKLKFHALFLQETHCFDKETASEWSLEWGPRNNSIWTTGSSNSKGVAILFKPHSDYQLSNIKIDDLSRYIYVEVCIDECEFKLINIYAPNNPKDRVSFFEELNSWVDIDKNNLVGGDYNCTLDSELDRKGCTSEYDQGRIELKEVINKKFLVDIFRKRNPDKLSFSFSRGERHSRLDYWLINKNLEYKVHNIEYKACPFSDHNMVVLTLDLSKIEIGPGIWKMNAAVIKSDLFKNCFTTMWKNWQKEKSKYHLHTWWDMGKKKIKQLTVWCSKKLKSDRELKRRSLETSLNREINTFPLNRDYIFFLEESIKKIISEECEGDRVRSRVKWFEEGEKSTAYFHGLEKYTAQKKNWTQILDENKVVVSGNDEILKVQTDFYKKLFKSEGSNAEQRKFFGNFIKNPIGPENFAILNKKIDLQDILSAMAKVKKNSSPGPDGILYEFYIEFGDVLADDLLEIFEISYCEKELAYSQYLALIILLYKKGQREDIRNWRPISLSNTDVKIISKILAERVRKVLPYIIHNNQCGCVKGRKIGQGIRLVDDIFENLGKKGLILIKDEEKAFDRVEWEWLFFVLQKFNFGDYFINWIKILYKDMKSAVLTNGYISEYFPLTRGIRQGDPLSALLYVIQSEALFECIRCDCDIKGIDVKDHGNINHEIKGSQYVDDANMMLCNIEYVPNCLGLLDKFGKASGSKLNKSKTLALVSDQYVDKEALNSLVKLNNGFEIILGVPVGPGRGKTDFWFDKFQKMEKRILTWKPRHLSIFGRVHISKSLVLPLIQYAAAHIDIPDDYIVKIQDLIWSYVWEPKTRFVAKEICYLPRISGGIGLPNVENMIKAARIKMLLNILEGEGDWTILPRKYFCCLDNMYGLKYFALRVTDSSEEIRKCNIPIFYKKCIIALQELNKFALVKNENDIIWCNDDIRFNKHVLQYRHWSKAGLLRVSDIISNGMIDKELIRGKLTNKSAIYFELSKLVKSVPKSMIENCSYDELYEFENFAYHVPGKKEPKNLFHLETKDIYSILVHGQVKHNKSKSYWNDKFQCEFDFAELFKNLFVCKITPRKALDFNWRLFNFSVNFEKYLVKMRLSNGKCKCCLMEICDAFHLFIECKYFAVVRNIVINMLNLLGYTDWLPVNWIFGFHENENNNKVANMILSCYRWSVWKRHCDEKSLNDERNVCFVKIFLNYITSHLEVLLNPDNLVINQKIGLQCRKLFDKFVPTGIG